MILFTCKTSYSQSGATVFQDWVQTAGTQYFFHRNVTKTDAAGNVYVAGATVNPSNGTTDMLVAKYNASGVQQWISQYNGAANQYDFATALAVDAAGNTYITGMVTNDLLYHYTDMITIKYNSSGVQQWLSTYNGAAGYYDSGTDLLIMSGGAVAVTGSTMNASGNMDFVTIAYNGSGVQQWATVYDHSSHMNDVPVQIVKKGSSIYVSGVVQTGATGYSWNVLQYNGSGVQQAVTTSSGGSSSIDTLNDMVSDAAGNIYIAGATSTATHGYNYDVIKLDSNLVIQWEKTYDGTSHLDDLAKAIGVDAAGNVYVTGSSKTTTQGLNYLTQKYDSGGNLLWTQSHNDSLNGDDAATGIELSSTGNIYITGSAYKDATHSINYRTIKYNPAGALLWTIDFDGSHHLKDRATNLALNDVGDVIVTGESETSAGVYEYCTVKYLENVPVPTAASMGVTNDQDGTPREERSTVIVRFNPAYLNMSAINNRDFHSSHANTFIADTLLSLMGQKLFTGTANERLTKMRNVTTSKIFTYMAAADSISITRSGEKMHVPPFWATLELFFPGMDERVICDSLQRIFPQIFYAHPNYAFTFFAGPSDSLYAEQASLAPTATYPNGNINIVPAWDIETGKKFIKVGVNDNGIDSLHPDIDVVQRANIEAFATGGTSSVDGHGTSVAGIIGAKRNNNIGIAGIAGGDGSDSTGCSIYDMDMGSDVELFAEAASEGIIMGAANYYYNTPFPFFPVSRGLGLHVMNDSWGGKLDDFTRTPVDPDDEPVVHFNCYLCLEAIEFAYRNGCVSAASRGNYVYVTGSLALPTDRIFPSCSKDEFILNVGSVGTDGQHKNHANGGDTYDTYESMYGWNVDVVAPGNRGTVYTTKSQTLAPASDLYKTFSGTSAAAPHVAGVAALMLSHVNTPCPSEKNLSPEDVEYILQKTANDRTISGIGYDDTTGFGLLDAGAALQAIEEPHYQIIHVNNAPVIISTVLVDTASLYLYSPYRGGNGPYEHKLPEIDDGVYYVDVYKTTAIINHASNLSHLTGSFGILDEWVRNSAAAGWGKYRSYYQFGRWMHDTVDVTSNTQLDSLTSTTATLSAYTYFVKYRIDDYDSIPINKWYPADSSQMKFSYSIYVYDPAATSVPTYPCDTTVSVQERKPIEHALVINNIYPNPAKDDLTIEYMIPYNAQASVNMIDLLGRTVKTMGVTSRTNGTYKVFINISNLAKGTYLLQVKTEKETVQKKLLIIR